MSNYVERISKLIDSFPLKICIDECDPILTDVELVSKSPCDCRKFEC